MGAIKLIKLRFDNAKLFALTLTIAVLASSYFSHALTDNAVIHNSATISLSSITAKSGSPTDIQAAVNTMAAAGGGTVYVPAGTYYWGYSTVTIPAGVNVIGTGLAGCSDHTSNWTSYTPSTILHSNLPSSSSLMPTMFLVQGNQYGASKPTRISGIQFEATGPLNYTIENGNNAAGVTVNFVYNFRIDHCTFVNFCNQAVFCDANSGMNNTASCYGVIDHCVCTNPYKLVNNTAGDGGWRWGYGFYSRGNMVPGVHGDWDNNTLDFFGQYKAVPSATIMYVEDCKFSYCRHSLDGITGGYYVARYDLFTDTAAIYRIGMTCLHGPLYPAGRGCEVYNCTFYAWPAPLTEDGNVIAYPWIDGRDLALQLRGGACIFANNTMYNNGETQEQAGLVYLDNSDIGSGPTYEWINQTYIWNNTLIGGGNTLTVAPEYTQNVNYFLRAPTQSLDGFTYMPYAYPIATG